MSGVWARRAAAVVCIAVACAVLAVSVYLLGGRGVRPTGVVAAGPAPAGIAPHRGEQVFLLRDGLLTPVVRSGRRGDVDRALAQLLAGPTAAERAHGLSSALPELAPGAAARVRQRRGAYGELRVELPGRVAPLSDRAVRQLTCTVARGLLAAGRVRLAASQIVVLDAAGRLRGVGDCRALLPPSLAQATLPSARATPSPPAQPTRP